MRFYQKYYPGNYEELITYYPKFYRDVLEMRAILEAHGAVLDELEDNIERVFLNNFIDTADKRTIENLERFLGIKVNSSRSLEVRRRFVKSFFVGFGKVSASTMEAIISSYTHGAVLSRFEPFDSEGNNMLRLEYRRGDVPTLYLEDITHLISKKMPAHILWHAMLTYHFEAGVRAYRHHYVIDYEIAGTKPEVSTLGGYSAAASAVKAGRVNALTDFPASEEDGVQSGQYPRDALLGSTMRAESVTVPGMTSHITDHNQTDCDRAGLLPVNTTLGIILKESIAIRPESIHFPIGYEASGVHPEAALMSQLIRQTSATEPSVQTVSADYAVSAPDGTQRAGTLPDSASVGVIVARKSVIEKSVESAEVDFQGASEDMGAGLIPNQMETGRAKGADAGAGIKAESFNVEYRYCGTGYAGS